VWCFCRRAGGADATGGRITALKARVSTILGDVLGLEHGDKTVVSDCYVLCLFSQKEKQILGLKDLS